MALHILPGGWVIWQIVFPFACEHSRKLRSDHAKRHSQIAILAGVSSSKKVFGASRVARIFNREKRSAYSWAQDPAFTEHRCKNPLDLMHALFVEFDARGLGYVARDAIAYLSTAVDDLESSPVTEPLPTIEAELLADFSAVASLKTAIDRAEPVDRVKELKREAVSELERTVARYIADTKRT